MCKSNLRCDVGVGMNGVRVQMQILDCWSIWRFAGDRNIEVESSYQDFACQCFLIRESSPNLPNSKADMTRVVYEFSLLIIQARFELVY